MTLAIFAAVIYDMGKCAVTEPGDVVTECIKRLDVCKSYLGAGFTCGSTYEALPIRSVQYRMATVKKGDGPGEQQTQT